MLLFFVVLPLIFFFFFAYGVFLIVEGRRFIGKLIKPIVIFSVPSLLILHIIFVIPAVDGHVSEKRSLQRQGRYVNDSLKDTLIVEKYRMTFHYHKKKKIADFSSVYLMRRDGHYFDRTWDREEFFDNLKHYFFSVPLQEHSKPFFFEDYGGEFYREYLLYSDADSLKLVPDVADSLERKQNTMAFRRITVNAYE